MDAKKARAAVRRRWRAPGLQGDVEAIGHAWRGLRKAVAEERPIQIELGFAAATVLIGWQRKISRGQWGLMALTISSVIGEEVRNASLERLCDFIEPDHDLEIGRIKDSSASAVLVRVIGSIALAGIIFWPKQKAKSL